MIDVMFQPNAVWDLYLTERYDIRQSRILIAERPEFGVEIFMEVMVPNPEIVVLVDDEEIYHEFLLSREDSITSIEAIYENYLYNVVNTMVNNDFSSVSEQMDAIDEREAQLDDAIFDCLSIVVPDFEVIMDFKDIDKLIDDLKDMVCELLYKEYKISVYRPMYLEDEDNREYYYDYPYEEMELD